MVRRLSARVLFSTSIVFATAANTVTSGQAADATLAVDPSQAVAIVAGEPITVQAFTAEMKRRASLVSFESASEKQALLDEMIRFQAVVAKALAAGYDKDPEIQATLRRLIASKYEREQLEPKLAKLTVTEEEVKQQYEANLASYTVPERSRAALVFLEFPSRATDAQKAAVVKKAEHALAEAKAQPATATAFGPLATNYSDDASSKYVGGEVGWLVKGEKGYRWDAAVTDAIFLLAKPGDTTPLVRTARGVYIARLVEKAGGAARPLERVKGAIEHEILQAKRDKVAAEFDKQLREAAGITVNREVLASVKAPTGPRRDLDKQPPALPPGN